MGRSKFLIMAYIKRCSWHSIRSDSRWQWPRGLRHKLPSSAQTLASWVRIPHKEIDVCACLFCVCVVLCAGRSLVTGWSPVQGVIPTACTIKKLKKRPRSEKKGCRAVARYDLSFDWLHSPSGQWPLFSLLIYSRSAGLLGRVVSSSRDTIREP
jgi:hypothetical protein